MESKVEGFILKQAKNLMTDTEVIINKQVKKHNTQGKGLKVDSTIKDLKVKKLDYVVIISKQPSIKHRKTTLIDYKLNLKIK